MAKMNLSFSLEGLDELREDLEKVYGDYPDATVKEMYRLAGVFIKDVNSKMPSEYMTGKQAIPKSWHRSRVKGASGATTAIEIENVAPHWPHVENGHTVKADPRMYAAYVGGRIDHNKSKRKYSISRSKNPNLKILGWAPGRKYCERTRDEWNSGKFAEHIRKYVNKMLKKNNL